MEVGTEEATQAAVQHGNLAALQLALQHCRQRQQEEGHSAEPPAKAVLCAEWSGHVPTTAWLHEAKGELHPDLLPDLLPVVLGLGHLFMLRWLLEAGCRPACSTTLSNVAKRWPSDTRTASDWWRRCGCCQIKG